jgi:amidase
VTSTEILEALLDRITRFNPRLNAIVTLDREGARQRAREADAAAERGQWWGTLHGVPITIKDAFDTAGLRTVSGHPRLAQRVPLRCRCRLALGRAGAIIPGKTNLPALANGIQSDNRCSAEPTIHGTCSERPGGRLGCGDISTAVVLDLGSDIGVASGFPRTSAASAGWR